jgi:NAD(P)-dependent dehydrogenase (short-subunit alcohol dehydrogenase family)
LNISSPSDVLFEHHSIGDIRMDRKFSGKTALIIGSTGGIGTAVTEALHEQGASLALFSRNGESLAAKQQACPGALTFCGDACSPVDLADAVRQTEERFGRIDIVIHAVGSILLRSLHTTSEEQFRRTLELNLVSPFITINAVLPGMLSRKSGSVIVCSSVAGSTGLKNHEAISAAKGGLNAMVRSAAMTYAKQNIRFNAVAFGLIDTPLAHHITKSEGALAASVAMHPLGRIGTPDDAVSALLYFASDESRWTTGQVLHVDGGLSSGK